MPFTRSFVRVDPLKRYSIAEGVLNKIDYEVVNYIQHLNYDLNNASLGGDEHPAG